MIKSYGITKNARQRYMIVLDIQEANGKLQGSPCYDLNYSKASFAEKKAHSFVRALYRNYKPFPELKYMGEIQL